MGFKVISKPEPKKEPTFFESAKETVSHAPVLAATGVLSEIGGTFGNIAKSVNDLIAAPITSAMGREPVPYEETFIGKALPTTQQNIKAIEGKFPSLKPKNKIEEFGRDVVTDTAALFLPGRYFRMGRYALTPMRSLQIATGANIAGKGTELWTGDKSKGELAKNGSMFLLSLWNPTTANNVVQNLYRSASAILPQNATQNAAPLLNRLNNLEARILQGRPRANASASEEFVLNQIDRIRNLEQNGQFNMRSLVAEKRSQNENLQTGLYNLTDRATRARARELAQEVNHAMRDTMRDYGRTNPQWWEFQSGADVAHGAIQNSNRLTRLIERFFRGRPENIAHLFGVGVSAAGTLLSPIGAAATTGGYQLLKTIDRMRRSPELRNHYLKVWGAAAADNPKLVHKELNNFQEALQEKEESKPGKFKVVKKG